jgi:hypothetical protein
MLAALPTSTQCKDPKSRININNNPPWKPEISKHRSSKEHIGRVANRILKYQLKGKICLGRPLK